MAPGTSRRIYLDHAATTPVRAEVVAAMQPIHATSDMNMAEDRIGPERIKGAYAWRRLLDSGAVIASGSGRAPFSSV